MENLLYLCHINTIKMNTFKKAKVVMLTTNEKVINTKEYQLLLSNSLFWTSKIEIERYTKGWFFLNNSSIPNSCAITVPNVENFKHQHLYIISDDEIKEGDWCLIDNNKVGKRTNKQTYPNCTDGESHLCYYYIINGEERSYHVIHCKKIIATTDTSLLIDTYINQGDTVKGDLIIKRGSDYTTGLKGRINLPQLSEQFIQKYIEEYNRGNIISDVLVEYELISNEEYFLNTINPDDDVPYFDERLTINPKDNTITIKKVKDIWNREEVVQLLIDCCAEISSIHGKLKGKEPADLYKWIEENL